MRETLAIFSFKTPLHAVLFFQEAPVVIEHMWVNPLLVFLVEATEQAATILKSLCQNVPRVLAAVSGG